MIKGSIKISQLSPIRISELDNNDTILINDVSYSGKVSRSATIGDLKTVFNKSDISLYSKFQLIKPYSSSKSHIHLIVSTDQDFSDVIISIDSRTNYTRFKCMVSRSSDNIHWESIDSTGFGIECNNKPVLVDIESDLTRLYSNLDNIFLYIGYYWYTIDEDNVLHKSDMYSMIVPSFTEVGANSQDVVSRTELTDEIGNLLYKSIVYNNMDEWSPTSSYSIGKLVIHDGNLYKCIESVELTYDGDEVIPNEFDTSKFELTTLISELNRLIQ